MLFIFSALTSQVPCLSKLYTKDCLNNYKEYTITAICDGDTVLAGPGKCEHGFSQNKVRLLGIDAFEIGQKPYGEASKKFLTNLLLNKKVCIELDAQEKDIYERTLGYVFLGKKFVNEELLKSGNAILYNFPPNIKYIKRLKKAQIYARQNMFGAWERHSYILETPAQWRHKHPYKKHVSFR